MTIVAADLTTTATTVALWVGVVLIGGIGSVLRFLVDRTVSRRLARPFPFGTLVVNTSGAVLLGLLGGLALSKNAALLAETAFVGAYTTFSTWMLETQRLGEERQTWAALTNIVVSLVLGLAAARLGQWVAEQI
ncbi:fluoride efflux transporter CrcB [Mycobacterium sp.]|uniref:fluoride efflux transporter CrcB n=1 Tax=Mycobacterium sp. TaxID=1785 RepID=UPI003C728027